MFHIFVIEDDKLIRENLVQLLRHALYKVTAPEWFDHGADEVKKAAPDLVLLDIGLPGTDGYEICEDIRRESDVPIIFVTGDQSPSSELNCLLKGADDYIVKPYQGAVLLARIAAVLKRCVSDKGEKAAREEQNRRGVCLNLAEATVQKDGKIEELTKNELKILSCLFKADGEIVSRDDLIEYLWDEKVFIDDNTLSVNMTRLRAKLARIGAGDFIETRRGLGYKI